MPFVQGLNAVVEEFLHTTFCWCISVSEFPGDFESEME